MFPRGHVYPDAPATHQTPNGSSLGQSMAKLISRAVFVLLAVTGSGSPAIAQVPGGGAEAVCQLVVGGIVKEQSGGTFPLGPADCEIAAHSFVDIAIQPVVKLSASVSAQELDPGDRNAAAATAALQYDFNLTGGNVGDVVPIILVTTLHTSVDVSDDPNNANSASATFAEFGVSSPGGRIVSNGPSTFACSVSPGPVDPDEPPPCPSEDSGIETLDFNMVTGTTGRIFMQVLVAASANAQGTAEGDIDPLILVDPRFPNAADYTITVLGGVANALPVPEPGAWALLLAGLGGLSATARRRRVGPARG